VRTRGQPGFHARQVIVNELDAAAYDDLLNGRIDPLHTGAADAVLGAEAKAPMLFKARGTFAAASQRPRPACEAPPGNVVIARSFVCLFVCLFAWSLVCLSDGAM
jgi:hypothetical protein